MKTDLAKGLFIFLFIAIPGFSYAELRLEGSFIQGGLLYGHINRDSEVYSGDRKLKISPNGDFILGFGRDAALQQLLIEVAPDGTSYQHEIELDERKYDIQKTNGIKQRMMTPNEEDLRRIRLESGLVAKARQQNSARMNFMESFIWPITGRISGVYGSQRILNGEPRRPHYGIDIAAPTGTPVKAPAGGIVTLAHQGMFFSGATLILDHGHGLSSSFLHLDKILVKKGTQISQGETIATVGATGRVTGPHLDWRINWFDQRLDPALLVPSMPQKSISEQKQSVTSEP